jgi:starch phosphorylase
VATFLAPEWSEVLDRFLGVGWMHRLGQPGIWEKIRDIPDHIYWSVRQDIKARMLHMLRHRIARQHLRNHGSESHLERMLRFCDPAKPNVLTIGFGRRFATYKRATLLLSQPERLAALLLSPDRPVQFVFAGKAHPADDLGKAMIQAIELFTHNVGVRHRFVFIDDYDIAVARFLYQGSDVWLNNPRRPLEACGTSGMKAALNGGLNCSILDGWWDECFDGSNGWAITSVEDEPDLARRDAIEAESLFDLLEHQIVPMFYERLEGPVPRRWTARVRHDLASLGPRVTAARMVQDYVTELYEPAAAQSDAALADGGAQAKALAAWKRRVLADWGGVQVRSVSAVTGTAELGTDRVVEAVVSLGRLQPDDVAVQLVHGPVGPADELIDPQFVTMAVSETEPDGSLRFQGSFGCEVAGRHGFTVRVVPSNPALATPVELGVIAWARS